MLASIPIELSSAALYEEKLKIPENELENEYFPRMGADRRRKGAMSAGKGLPPEVRGQAQPIESRGHWRPDRNHNGSMLVDKHHTKTNLFLSRSKSGNLSKLDKPAVSDKKSLDPEGFKLPLLTNAESLKKTVNSPHRLGFVKPQPYERLEAFKIYKNSRKNASLSRLMSTGFQGRPNTPTVGPRTGREVRRETERGLGTAGDQGPEGDERTERDHGETEGEGPVSRPVSRVSFPPAGRPFPNELDAARRFPNRTMAAKYLDKLIHNSPPTEAAIVHNEAAEETRPALKVMNFEPVIIPEEMRPPPARSPLIPRHSPDHFYAGSGAWNPGQIDKPRNLLRPTGGYGKHRASIVLDTGPMGRGFHTSKLPGCLVAPTQANPTVIRQNYAKNLERNWLKRMHEENTRKKRNKVVFGWLRSRKPSGKHKFEASFFSSDSESDSDDGAMTDEYSRAAESEVGATPRVRAAESEVGATPRVRRSVSLEVLLSDSELDNEDTHDINIVLRDGELVDKVVTNKMQRKRWTRRKKFNDIIKISRELEIAEKVAAAINTEVDPEYIGGIEGMTGENDLDLAIDEQRYFQDWEPGVSVVPMPPELEFLTDKEIRAMRLKLKVEPPQRQTRNDASYIGDLAASLLAGLKTKEKKAKKKKKKDNKSGKKVKWNKNDDYNEYERKTPVQVTAKDQFIEDFGHWLDSRVDWRLDKERAEGQASADPGALENKDDGSTHEEEEEPCCTELALRGFNDDYALLTNLLLDTRRPFERFTDLNETDKKGVEGNTPRIDNVLLSGMVAATQCFKVKSYEDLKVPVSRRQSDPGLERLKQIKFTVPVKKRRSQQRHRSSSQSSRSSRRSSVASEVDNETRSSRARRPQTPGVYKIRRRISQSRITSAASDISDDDSMSIKSFASSRVSTGTAGGARKRASKLNKRTPNGSPSKRASPVKGASPVKISQGSSRRSSVSRGSCGEERRMSVEELEYIIDLDDLEVARPGSARRLAQVEPEIDLWDLTKGIDFPAKDIKINIINRKRRRQRKKRQMMIQAETRGLQKANKMAECILFGRKPDNQAGSGSDLSSSDESEESETPEEPPKPWTFALDSPFVSAYLGLARDTSSRVRLKLSNKQLDDQILNLGELFKEMIECRYIRWSARDWAIIERLHELELLE